MQECFVVLEPVNHMYKVIEAAAAKGKHIVVFHTTPMAAAGEYKKGFEAIGEKHLLESWHDEQAALQTILKYLEGRKVCGTYAAVETVLLVEVALREHAGLPTHGVATMNNLLDKRWVRAQLRAAGLTKLSDTDPRSVARDGVWPFGDNAAYLKPITGGGSVHVNRCRNVQDVVAGLREWDEQTLDYRPILRQHLMRGGGLFLEEGADGELMSLEGWVSHGKYTALGLTSRTILERDPTIEMGATFPYEHPLRADIEAKIGAIHQALGLVHGPTHAELIVCKDGSVELVELNVRFGGSDILLLINHALGVPVDAMLADLACGLDPQLGDARNNGYACMQQLLAPAGTAVLDSIELEQDLLIESRMLKGANATLVSTDYQNDHVCTYMVQAATYPAVLEKAARVRSTAKINGKLLENDRNNVVILR